MRAAGAAHRSALPRRVSNESSPNPPLFLYAPCQLTIATRSPARSGPHSVASAAADIVEAVSELGRPPDIVIGHSFGGKVHVLALADRALLYDAFDAR